MSLREVLTGELVLNEPISASLSVLRRDSPAAALLSIDGPFWWLPNVAALRRYLEMAGFEVVAQGRPYMLGYGASAPVVPHRAWRGAGTVGPAAARSPSCVAGGQTAAVVRRARSRPSRTFVSLSRI